MHAFCWTPPLLKAALVVDCCVEKTIISCREWKHCFPSVEVAKTNECWNGNSLLWSHEINFKEEAEIKSDWHNFHSLLVVFNASQNYLIHKGVCQLKCLHRDLFSFSPRTRVVKIDAVKFQKNNHQKIPFAEYWMIIFLIGCILSKMFIFQVSRGVTTYQLSDISGATESYPPCQLNPYYNSSHGMSDDYLELVFVATIGPLGKSFI